MDAVAAPREQAQRRPRLLLALRLGEDPPAGGDHRIGGEHQRARLAHGLGLLGGHPAGVAMRKLAPARRLVDLGRQDRVGDHADAPQEREPSRAG